MGLSLERLELLLAAHARRQAAQVLELAQLVSLGMAGGQEWQRRQRELIARTKP